MGLQSPLALRNIYEFSFNANVSNWRISRIFIFYSLHSIISEIRVKKFLILQKPYPHAENTFRFLNG